MWPRLHPEQLISEARALRGVVARTGSHSTTNPMAWEFPASDFASFDSLQLRVGAVSFQKGLQQAEKQGLTLREFEKRLV